MGQGSEKVKGKRVSTAEIYMLAVVGGIILAAAVMLLLEIFGSKRSDRIPDFGAIESVDEKKEAFFQFLLPMVHEENRKLMEKRKRILELKERFDAGKQLGRKQRRWLAEVNAEMEFEGGTPEEPKFFDHLLTRVDAIPPSLALAQAANESAWGTSRFAREGNNFYGIWCYQPGCGLVPRRRPAGATYEVTRYRSPAESVADYFHNLNTGTAYIGMRAIRKRLRERGEPIRGIALANGLERYSERGMAYVGDIQNLIRSNDLQQYDR